MSEDSVSSKSNDQEEIKDAEEYPKKPRLYKSSFDTSLKDEKICPFKGCGRKFFSDAQLKLHLERRHPPIKKIPETSVPAKGNTLKETKGLVTE